MNFSKELQKHIKNHGWNPNRKDFTNMSYMEQNEYPQFLQDFKDNNWISKAKNANLMAQYLTKELESMSNKEIKLLYPVESNILFVKLPTHTIQPLQE